MEKEKKDVLKKTTTIKTRKNLNQVEKPITTQVEKLIETKVEKPTETKIEKPIAEKEKINMKKVKQTNTISISNVLNQYIIDKLQFRIYYKTDLIFDSKNKLKKDYPIFKENDFIVGDNIYIYKGIRIETY